MTVSQRKAFDLLTKKGEYSYPFAKLRTQPTRTDRVLVVFPDADAGSEAFTYRLQSGAEDTVHLDAVLEYTQDLGLLSELLLYRLLDPTYYGKSVGQVLALLRLLGLEVEVVVTPAGAPAVTR